jgi:hypothetical protein
MMLEVFGFIMPAPVVIEGDTTGVGDRGIKIAGST